MLKHIFVLLNIYMPVLRNIYFNQDIFFVLFVISFFLIALLKSNYFKYTKLLIYGVFSQRYANQFLREDNFFTERVSIITSSLLVLNCTLLLSKILLIDSLFGVCKVAIYIVLYFLFKVITIKILSNIFILKELGRLIIFFSLLFDRVLSICIFPILIAMYFLSFNIMNLLMLFTMVVFCILLLCKIFCFWNLGSNLFGISKFYIFLYLCILELFPLLLLFNYIQLVI